MAGITDRVFRRICREHGADVVVSEMVSAEGLRRNLDRNRHYIEFSETERPIGIQLFGADPGTLAYAARVVEEQAAPDFVDLNCGCPVPKVVRRNGGSALLRDRPLFARIVSAMVKAVSVPVTVKLRCGWSAEDRVDVDFARTAADLGVTAVTLHPRTRAMGFTGHSMWDRIAAVKSAVAIPVVGNGDVSTPAEAFEMLRQTGCDSVMIGRYARGNPWIFGQTRQVLRGKNPDSTTIPQRRECMLSHIRAYRETHGELRALRELRAHLSWYVRGIAGAGSLRARMFAAQSTSELERLVDETMDAEGAAQTEARAVQVALREQEGY